jgi:hypothetical protein
LKELSAQNVGGFRHSWNEAAKTGWSNFNSKQFATVRAAMAGSPLWEIERYWRGYQ